MTEPILFFDGECNLCNGAVQFVIRHDRVGRVHFSALQSERGRAAREAVSDKDFSSIILWHEGRYSVMSEAGLAVCGYLDWPWTWLRFLRVLPRGWRKVDGVEVDRDRRQHWAEVELLQRMPMRWLLRVSRGVWRMP